MTSKTNSENQKVPGFYVDIMKDGYHIFSLTRAQIPGFYPNKFPDYPGVKVAELALGVRITVRAFFRIGSGEPARFDSGLIDLKLEHIDADHIRGKVLTQLPQEFPVKTGGSLDVCEDEILYKHD